MSSRYLVKKRYKNLSRYRLYKSEISGHDTNTMFMIPEDGLEHMPHNEVIRALKILEAALQQFEIPRFSIMTQLKVLLINLHRSQDDYLGDNSLMAEATSLINKHDGVKTLVSLLMLPDLGGRWSEPDVCDHSITVGTLQATTLNVLKKLTTMDTTIGCQLSDSDEVLQILFSLMLDSETYTKAITLIEHLLILRRSTLQLNTIPGLDRLISQLDGEYLANFCSILAVTISDLDVYENKTLLYEQSMLRSNIKSLSPLRDINQEYILSIPEFLPRLVNFATKLPYEPRYSGRTMEVDHWMRFIDDSMSEVLRQHESLMPSPTLNSAVSVTDLLDRIQPQAIPSQIEALTSPMLQRVESVYVLGLLLLGKQRKEVQTQLAKLRLIPRLSQLFDLFIWKCETYQERIRVPGHLSSCECSPEVALKIQFLRLVHSFCDQSEYRYLMLTPTEYREVCSISAAKVLLEDTPSPTTTTSMDLTMTQGSDSNGCASQESSSPTSVLQEESIVSRESSNILKVEPLGGSGLSTQVPVEYPTEQMCSGPQGLLSKIVEALKKETTGSTFRFWFSRAIESYLRSANPYADQVFLLRRGLLKEKKLFRLVTKNLVDSNMLVRSLVLSNDLFTREGKAIEFAFHSRTLRHVATFKQRLDFLVQLIKTISVDTLTQENVSCLNTSLVILMLAHRHSELPLYLEGLRSHVEPHLLTNLRSLLRFWQTHYLHNKDKDCNTLQRSSGISFDFWRETVATLVAENKLSPDCIFHYFSPEDLSLSRTS
ncbi:Short transient receptor potential channel 4-associated protein-like [Homarus americanus]|uniref:Short transient receptor potential channel 4-associated protein-like n=1 Tax=Homarus americanus TaxID=6706 RepID=A0A8J5K212_HOMAM|nr:Short transient receptor potential channel 4-associated protein-like [Homarus americanus]